MNFDKILISRKSALSIALVTALILLIPLIAMQLTNEVSWQFGDFIVAAILLFSFGYLYVILANKTSSNINKTIIGIFVLALLVLIWAVIAVDLL